MPSPIRLSLRPAATRLQALNLCHQCSAHKLLATLVGVMVEVPVMLPLLLPLLALSNRSRHGFPA